MAGKQGLKGFYGGMAVLVVVGVAAIWWAVQGREGGTAEIGPVPVVTGIFAGHVQGSDSAPVEIIEYADFSCPACAQFSVLTGPDIKQRLVETGQVRWIFRDFPLEMHPNSAAAHLAAACAGEQSRFWSMHDQLFFRLGDWAGDRRPERKFRDYAEAIGLDVGQYRDCMNSGRLAGQIEAARQSGIELGVHSTPTFIVGNLRVSGSISYDSLKVLVDRAAGESR